MDESSLRNNESGGVVTLPRSVIIVGVFIVAIVAGIVGFIAGISSSPHSLSTSPQLVGVSPSKSPGTSYSNPVISTSLPTNLPSYGIGQSPSPYETTMPHCEVDINSSPWKKYTSPEAGVSFVYPASDCGHVRVGEQDLKPGKSVTINMWLSYFFRITKYTSESHLQSLWPLPTGTQQTTFHGYPANLKQATAETAGQVPMNIYIVKVNPSTYYVIEYEVPDPRATTDPAYRQDKQEIEFLTTGMQKILNSVSFFTSQ